MEMIVHQHEGVHLDSMLPASATQEATKVMPIIIVQEDGAPVYAALESPGSGLVLPHRQANANQRCKVHLQGLAK
jgi:hypothetical protein